MKPSWRTCRRPDIAAAAHDEIINAAKNGSDLFVRQRLDITRVEIDRHPVHLASHELDRSSVPAGRRAPHRVKCRAARTCAAQHDLIDLLAGDDGELLHFADCFPDRFGRIVIVSELNESAKE